jgi:ATP-dependent Clp protease adaptor protein ClpS
VSVASAVWSEHASGRLALSAKMFRHGLVAMDEPTRLSQLWANRLASPNASRGAASPAFRIAAAKEPRREGEDDGPGSGTAVVTRPKPQTRHPNMYRVLLLNDDYTPMEFVVSILRKYFNKDVDEATRIMWHVHQHGVGECGVFSYEVAEMKVTQVMDHARKHQHPLQCIMEKK